MKGLETLIKMQQREIDILRKQIMQLEQDRVRAHAQITQINQQITRESQANEASVGFLDMFANFLGRMEGRKVNLNRQIESIEQRRAVIENRLREQFAELKKYEIARDNRLAEEQAALEKQMQSMLDEIAIQRYNHQ